jgi:hypothetical protein
MTEKEHSDPNITREEFIAQMEPLGFEPSYPADNELQIDLDSMAQQETFDRCFAILEREILDEYGKVPVKITTPSQNNTHTRVTLPFIVSAWERIAWQAALGSDPVRELLSCLRALRGDSHPTMLMEKKK